MTNTKTPLTDKLIAEAQDVNYVFSSDSRAIELRLNECVEALQFCSDHAVFGVGWLPDNPHKMIINAITNARKPL